jgi:hypothetical protein
MPKVYKKPTTRDSHNKRRHSSHKVVAKRHTSSKPRPSKAAPSKRIVKVVQKRKPATKRANIVVQRKAKPSKKTIVVVKKIVKKQQPKKVVAKKPRKLTAE